MPLTTSEAGTRTIAGTRWVAERETILTQFRGWDIIQSLFRLHFLELRADAQGVFWTFADSTSWSSWMERLRFRSLTIGLRLRLRRRKFESTKAVVKKIEKMVDCIKMQSQVSVLMPWDWSALMHSRDVSSNSRIWEALSEAGCWLIWVNCSNEQIPKRWPFIVSTIKRWNIQSENLNVMRCI